MPTALRRFVLAAAVLMLPNCPKPGPNPGVIGHVVKCASKAIQDCAPAALPAVNECLAGAGDIIACLGLIQPIGCAAEDVIACLVRHERTAAASVLKLNPDNASEAHRAARAEEYLSKRGVTFAD